LAKGVVYTPDQDFNGSDTLTISANDQGQGTATTQTIALNVVNPINGTPGQDTLTSTAGNDYMTGGPGADQFKFITTVNNTSVNTGHDIISDFLPAQDTINLDYNAFTATGPNSFNNWLAGHATIQGSDVLIDLNPDGHSAGADTILLKNITLASLHANNFV
jgi:Ca2+-binding RTX toxin-like protein